LVIGQGQSLDFYQIELDPPRLREAGVKNGLRGSVTQIESDPSDTTVYVMTSRKMLYSVSGTTFQINFATQFPFPLMQLALTQMFIIVSCAPNDIIFAERNREKWRQIMKFEVSAGLRRFSVSSKAIIIVTKEENVERRDLGKIGSSERICLPESADYDPGAYKGVVYSVGHEIYLAHGNRISYWI
jgi:hypothetical protein